MVINAQYHTILTDCTDPVHCLSGTSSIICACHSRKHHAECGLDEGGLGVDTYQAYTAELSWGISRNGTTADWRRLDLKSSRINKLWLCRTIVTAMLACGIAATPIPLGISQNPRSCVPRHDHDGLQASDKPKDPG